MSWQHPTGGRPKVIDIIALGPSQREYHNHQHAAYNPVLDAADETWIVNKGMRTVKSDLAFVLDDLEGERRRSLRYAGELIEYAMHRPIITSEIMDCERSRWPGRFYNYPLTKIIDSLGLRLAFCQGVARPTPEQAREAGLQGAFYLHNSVPMILAYALFIGVKEIRLFGADYTIRNYDHMEENRPNCEYWVGFLRACGVRIRLPQSTTLLNTDQSRRTYGYARDPILDPLPT
jgi:hypothetical protein